TLPGSGDERSTGTDSRHLCGLEDLQSGVERVFQEFSYPMEVTDGKVLSCWSAAARRRAFPGIRFGIGAHPRLGACVGSGCSAPVQGWRPRVYLDRIHRCLVRGADRTTRVLAPLFLRAIAER